MSVDRSASRLFRLTYSGHCAFLRESPAGLRVLIDPYRNGHDHYRFPRHFPSVESHLALITQAHLDHAAVDRLAGQGL
jgi:L-ascorbate metabolism protein UlaG (beta-lactamase superfamily)